MLVSRSSVKDVRANSCNNNKNIKVNFIEEKIIRMNLDTRPYIFPRNLSRDYHGPVKPRQRLASIHRQKFRQQTLQNPNQYNPEHHTYRTSDMLGQSRRLDQDVIKERSQLITNSTRVSKDTPEWWKSTFKYFNQSEMSSITQNLRQNNTIAKEKQYDVFNRRRNQYMTIDNSRMDTIYKNQSTLADREDQRDRIGSRIGQTMNRSFFTQRDVSPKVGSLQIRDYTIKKPTLKIGTNNYVDTYSVF